MAMVPLSNTFMPSATVSPARPEAPVMPFDHADHNHVDEAGNRGAVGMEFADIYGAILVVVPLGILAKSLLL